ncbi:MAG TPA: hypothetical protein VHZ99_07040 [Steroidobacteraceae bacterium]|nr:hypothetical protein [Steroidobacteraceae bacterium]
MPRIVPQIVLAALLLTSVCDAVLCDAASTQAIPSACSYLTDRIAAMPAGPVLLASYPTERSGPLGGVAFTYDNAVAAIALIGCHQTQHARRIGDALLLALDHDRFWHDGRLRNAYAAGAIGTAEPVRLSGWWDPAAQRWMEDRYQVGSDSGNMAWAMLALETLQSATDDRRYLDGAVRLAHWVEGRADARGAGGFTGGEFGHEPGPENDRWKSTEHNTDLAAAFARLARATGEAHWSARSQQARAFVEAMWLGDEGYFAVGSAEDGVQVNPLLALDAQIWPLLALPGAAGRYHAALVTSQRRLRSGAGYTYSQAGGGLWSEGTAQAAVLTALLHQDAAARAIAGSLKGLRTSSGGCYASDVPATPTGFMLATDPSKPRVYFHLEHLGASAWLALYEQRIDPFTGRSALP